MNRILKALLALDGAFIFASGMLVPIYAIFVEHIGGDILDASGAMAAFSLSFALIVYFISRWENHLKHKKKLIFFGYGLMAVSFLFYYFVSNSFELFLVQILLGVSGAIASPAYDGMYSKFLDKGKFVYDWGLWETMNSAVLGVAAIAGGLIAFEFGFRTLFLVMFAFSVAGMVLAYFMLDDSSF